MAGGIGSRFWPVSTPEKPKQFIDILGTGETLLQTTVRRFQQLVAVENILVVSNAQYFDIIKAQIKGIPSENILLEPCMRNTAPCIGYAVNKIYSKNKSAKIIVSPADHFIADEKEFSNTFKKCLNQLDSSDSLITIGIKPTFPATGYGYIKFEKSDDTEFKNVDSFVEKPNLQKAAQYIAEGNYLWNSGAFIWKAQTIIDAFAKYLPQINNTFKDISDVYYTEKEQETIDKVFPECKNISIDYGIMEKASNVLVIPGDFGWSDIGSWRAVSELGEKDSDGNHLNGNVQVLESKNNIISISDKKKAVIQGVDDLLIVEEGDNLLICKKEEDQRIKEFSCLIKK